MLLVVGRAFVAHDDTAGGFGFTLGLAFQKHLHAARQEGDFRVLSGDDLGEVIDGAGQEGDLGFELFHTVCDRRHGRRGQATRRPA